MSDTDTDADMDEEEEDVDEGESGDATDLRELYLETAGEEELVESQDEDDERLDEDGVDLDGAIDSGLDEAIEGTESDASGGAASE